jgi:hypothetical protein
LNMHRVCGLRIVEFILSELRKFNITSSDMRCANWVGRNSLCHLTKTGLPFWACDRRKVCAALFIRDLLWERIESAYLLALLSFEDTPYSRRRNAKLMVFFTIMASSSRLIRQSWFSMSIAGSSLFNRKQVERFFGVGFGDGFSPRECARGRGRCNIEGCYFRQTVHRWRFCFVFIYIFCKKLVFLRI